MSHKPKTVLIVDDDEGMRDTLTAILKREYRVLRVSTGEAAYRPGHRFGNLLLTGMVARIFGDRVTDMSVSYTHLTLPTNREV